MKTYDLTYIISPELTSEEATAVAKEIESFIQNNEGVILKASNPVAKTLSYQIKKHASGFVGSIEFQIESEKIKELEEKIQKDVKVVRHMVLIKEPVRIRKIRRSKPAPVAETEQKLEVKPVAEESSPAKVSEEKQKVELKDIEQKLDEILGE